MRLLWYHPGPAAIDCEDCRRHIYDLERGERKTYLAGAGRVERPQPRLPGMPMQCGDCPKQSPERGRELRLSERNLQMLRLYNEVRATAGACLTEEMRRDRLLMLNLSDLAAMDRVRERQRLAEEIGYHTALLLVKRG